MSDQQALARIEPGEDESGLTLRDHVYHALKSGFLPGVKDIDAAMALVQKGRELGLQPMQALDGIHIIEGRPSPSASLIAALIARAHGDDALIPVVWDNTQCTISFKRRSWATRAEFTYTIDDAKRAGLTGKKPWQMNPASMLFARCVSTIGRRMFADALAGLGPVEDLDDDDEPMPNDLPARPVFDAAYWCARWFTTVEKDSRFDTDEARADFLRYHTQGEYDSLKAYLHDHIEDAGRLISAVETAIAVGDYSMLRDQPAPADYSEFADLIAPEMAEAGQIRRNGATPDPKPTPPPDDIDEPAPADDLPDRLDEQTEILDEIHERIAATLATGAAARSKAPDEDAAAIKRVLRQIVGSDERKVTALFKQLVGREMSTANPLKRGEGDVLRDYIRGTNRQRLQAFAPPQGAMLS